MKKLALFVLLVMTLTLSTGSVHAQKSVTGSGTPGKIPVWTGTTTQGDSAISQDESRRIAIGGFVLDDAELTVRSQGDNIGILGRSTGGAGLRGTSTTAEGVFGLSDSGRGVVGQSNTGRGVQGQSLSFTGVLGTSESGVGTVGESTSSFGVVGRSTSGTGVIGESTSSVGVQGQSTSEPGVVGVSTSGRGVEGQSDSRGGVAGFSNTGVGVGGVSTSGAGIVGTSGAGGSSDNAGVFEGRIIVSGPIIAGAKFFRIDHPLDPANKYLNHTSVESPEMKNIYDGVAMLDGNGEAVVRMPEWFSALNTEFRYQLTAIGAPGPNLYIAEKMAQNRFKIAGGTPRMEVSWQVTGVRQDEWAKANPVQVEEEKPDKERGTYIHPALFNEPDEKGRVWVDHAELMREAKERRTTQQAATPRVAMQPQ